MEELRSIANATYEKLPEEKKQLVLQLFKSIDQNGDGKIATSEFFRFFETNSMTKLHGRSPSWLMKLYQELDEDGNGSLDFNEFIPLFYLLFFGVCCAGCEAILNGNTYFTCVQCFNQKPSFDLCRSCYSQNHFTHTHENGVNPVFQDSDSLPSKIDITNIIRIVIKVAKIANTTHSAFNLVSAGAAAAGVGCIVM